ncbi:hypothetical protein MSAN_00694200 [Mycena sanguinolenta]|uniref:Uncharacterized protein n=1 Tax=Mycena sanguinolenta TaxID=230812 RepID=A0A8H6Z4K4_9AGAR|nr:hypothetical protein MSAN_00694200 [Mycena sanguinolenta]
MATSPEKTAEFARLFQLFEMLATRRSRMAATGSTSLDDTHAIPIPAELEPVFRSLATVVPPRQPALSLSGRVRRNTVAALGRTTYPDSDNDNDSDSGSDVESVAKFPLGKTYTFTFKMMIHKLYQVDEWAQKVRDVLARSQIEYKPLAERQEVKKADAPAAAPVSPEPGRVHFKTDVTVGGRKSTIPLAASRTRRHSNAGPCRVVATATAHTRATPSTAAPISDDARAVKKRCIGRRKSLSGPLSPASPVGEGWIYDAAISSAEVRERVRVEATPTFVPIIRPRPRYQSLESGNKKLGFGPRRIVSAAVGTSNTGAETAPRISAKRRL